MPTTVDSAGSGPGDPPAGRSFGSALGGLCAAEPDATWLTLVSPQGERAHTYAELSERVSDYAALYAARGAAAGDLVLIVLRESLDLFASFFAAVATGVVPAYSAYPSPKQSAAAFLRAIEDLVRWNRIRLVVGYSEVVSLLGARGSLDDPTFLGYVEADAVPARGAPWVAPARPDREAFLQFSSGTTGAKKGVRISAQALFNQLDAYSPIVRFDGDSRVVSWLPHYHDMGLIACMLLPVLSRAPIVMMSPFEWVKRPRLVFDAITRHRGTHLWLPNFALGHLVNRIEEDELTEFDLASIRQLVCCSEPTLAETVAAFHTRFARCGFRAEALRSCYAMAENTFAMTSTRTGPVEFLEVDPQGLRAGEIRARPGGRPVASVGAPLSNLALRVVTDDGTPAGEDRVGEIWIKSDCMLEGYQGNPEATAAALIDGWFRTGDLGFLQGGQLYVTGRRKELIIVGGENIYPQDIEHLLNQQPALIPGRSVAFGVADERVGTERIVVLAERAPERPAPDSAALRKAILDRLGVAVSETLLLPPQALYKSTAGKVSRHLNRERYLAGAFDGFLPPAEAAAGLAELVRSVIPWAAKPRLERDTPLLSSGIVDSFAFLELVLRLEEMFGVQIPEPERREENFETIAAIERLLDACRSGAAPAGDANPLEIAAARRADLESLLGAAADSRDRAGLYEWLINHAPLRASWVYRLLLRRAGVGVGRGVRFRGAVRVKLRGRPGNIVLGDGVELGERVDLRNREQGRIVLAPRARLDDDVRIVAARDGLVEIGTGTVLGKGTIVNSGGLTRLGRFCLIAGYVNLNASSHGLSRRAFIRGQAHRHGTIEIGDDVWLGAGVTVLVDSRIHDGAVIAANSVVSGEIPAFAIASGIPARVVRYRS